MVEHLASYPLLHSAHGTHTQMRGAEQKSSVDIIVTAPAPGKGQQQRAQQRAQQRPAVRARVQASKGQRQTSERCESCVGMKRQRHPNRQAALVPSLMMQANLRQHNPNADPGATMFASLARGCGPDEFTLVAHCLSIIPQQGLSCWARGSKPCHRERMSDHDEKRVYHELFAFGPIITRRHQYCIKR